MSPEEEGWIKLGTKDLLKPPKALAQTSTRPSVQPKTEEEFWTQTISNSPKGTEFFWPPPPSTTPPPASPNHERNRKLSNVLMFCEERILKRTKTPKTILEVTAESNPRVSVLTATSSGTDKDRGGSSPPHTSVEVIVGEPDVTTGSVKITVNVFSNR